MGQGLLRAGLFQWTPQIGEADTYQVRFSVTDAAGLLAEQVVGITILPGVPSMPNGLTGRITLSH